MTSVIEQLRRSPESELPPVAPRKHPWRTGFAVFLVVAAAWSVYLLAGNERFGWDVIGTYLFSGPVLDGLVLTLWLTAVSMAIGILLGIVLAVMRSSDNFVISGLAAGYIWFFRGVPLLVLLVFFYNLAALFPTIGVGIPGIFSFVDLNTNALITPVFAAIIGLGLNEAAFMSEIVRAGMRSVDRGQVEAARALGMSPNLVMRRIVMPQAMRLIIPPTANEIVNMLKTTSLVSVLAVADLMYSVQQIYASNFQTIPLLLVASFWYLVLTSVLSVGQYFLEKRYSKGVHVRKPRLARRRAEGGSR
ncbi:amino acid ABC transporter permease [Streptomyces sp. NPDC047981]|uniref:amino acid ABC transporter permease n=1 Tax=Streptomyces sp. NPDC047981 TaxID=3154610 RepID=UPI003433B21E